MEQDDTKLQFDENGNLRHLLSLKGIDATLLTELLDDAEGYLTASGRIAGSKPVSGWPYRSATFFSNPVHVPAHHLTWPADVWAPTC